MTGGIMTEKVLKTDIISPKFRHTCVWMNSWQCKVAKVDAWTEAQWWQINLWRMINDDLNSEILSCEDWRKTRNMKGKMWDSGDANGWSYTRWWEAVLVKRDKRLAEVIFSCVSEGDLDNLDRVMLCCGLPHCWRARCNTQSTKSFCRVFMNQSINIVFVQWQTKEHC